MTGLATRLSLEKRKPSLFLFAEFYLAILGEVVLEVKAFTSGDAS
jgi:hypothetical protein